MSSMDKAKDIWELWLYVAGKTPKSKLAIERLKQICDEYLPDQCKILVVDLEKNPALAKINEIIAMPTLIKKLPEPVRKLIGDLSNTERVLMGLDIVERKKDKEPVESK
ncbi:MAG: circadian clock KaiB family protein [Candidatus Latescibacterota bacterium]